MPVPPSMFPTWPAKSEMTRGKRREKSPKPPEGAINLLVVSEVYTAALIIISSGDFVVFFRAMMIKLDQLVPLLPQLDLDLV